MSEGRRSQPPPAAGGGARGAGSRLAPRLVPLGLALLGAGYYLSALLLRHAQYDTYAFDLGLVAQVSWNTLRGRWFETTVLPFNYLAEHFAPSLVLVSPIFLVWPDVRALLVVQALAVAAASLGVYWAARVRTGDAVAAGLIQAAFVLAPGTGWVARDEFHPITLAMPALAFAAGLLWRGRAALATFVGALALLANEDAALVVGPFGLLIAATGAWKWGLGLSALAAGWLGGYLFVLSPMVRPPELATALPHPDLRAFSQCGNHLAEILLCLLDPRTLPVRATTEGDRAALLTLLGPTLGLGALGSWFLVVLPRWLLLLLGNDPPAFELHYVALLVVGAYLASIQAAAWAAQRTGRTGLRLVGLGLALGSALGAISAGPLPGGGRYTAPDAEWLARVPLMDRAVALVPSDAASVTATSAFLPRFALRPVVTLPLDAKCPQPDYRVLYLNDIYGVPERLRGAVARLAQDPRYEPLMSERDVVVLRRIEPTAGLARDDLFSGRIRLLRVIGGPRDEGLGLALTWRKEAATPVDYHYFVHLVDRDRRLFSQSDGQLLGGALPTRSWSEGCRVDEEVALAAPPRSEWAAYHLEIGWYDFGSGERLVLPGGQDFVRVGLDELMFPG